MPNFHPLNRLSFPENQSRVNLSDQRSEHSIAFYVNTPLAILKPYFGFLEHNLVAIRKIKINRRNTELLI